MSSLSSSHVEDSAATFGRSWMTDLFSEYDSVTSSALVDSVRMCDIYIYSHFTVHFIGRLDAQDQTCFLDQAD